MPASTAGLYSKSKCVLILTAVEMQITPETAFVQQQHHCSCLRELQCVTDTLQLSDALCGSIFIMLSVLLLWFIAARLITYFPVI